MCHLWTLRRSGRCKGSIPSAHCLRTILGAMFPSSIILTFRDERELDTNKMFKENCLKLILGLKTVLSATHLRRGALYCFLAMLFWYALCTQIGRASCRERV